MPPFLPAQPQQQDSPIAQSIVLPEQGNECNIPGSRIVNLSPVKVLLQHGWWQLFCEGATPLSNWSECEKAQRLGQVWSHVLAHPFHVGTGHVSISLCLFQHFALITRATATAGKQNRQGRVQHLVSQVLWKWAAIRKSFCHCDSNYRDNDTPSQEELLKASNLANAWHSHFSPNYSFNPSFSPYDCPSLKLSSAVKIWQFGVIKWAIVSVCSIVSNIKVAVFGFIHAQYNAILECICPAIAFWFSVMWMPSSQCAFPIIRPHQGFPTGGTALSLPVPSSFYNCFRKIHNHYSFLTEAQDGN